MFGVGYVGIVRTTLLADTAQFDSAMMGASRSFKRAAHDIRREAQSLFSTSAGLNLAITLPLALAARNIVKTGADFDATMMKMRQTAKISTTEFSKLADSMMQVSRAMRISPMGLAQTGYQAAQAQLTTPHAIKSFQSALAKGQKVHPGDASDEDVASGFIANINAFKFASKDFTRVMAEMDKTIVLGRQSWKEYAGTISQVAALAAAIPVGDKFERFKNMNVALALATQGGVHPSQASTALRNIYLRIYKRSQVGNSELNTVAASYGYTNAAEMFEKGAGGDPTKFLQILGRKINFGELAKQTAYDNPESMTKAGFLQREITTALQLSNASPTEVSRYREEYNSSLADFEEKYAEALNHPLAIMEGIAAAADRVKIKFFEAVEKPIISFLKTIERIVTAIEDMSKFQKQVLAFSALAATLTVVIRTIFGFFYMMSVGNSINKIVAGRPLGKFEQGIMGRIQEMQKKFAREGRPLPAASDYYLGYRHAKAPPIIGGVGKSHSGGDSVKGMVGLGSIITKLTTTLVKTNHLLAQILRQCCNGVKGVGARRTRAGRYPIVPYGHEGGLALYNGPINPEVLPPESRSARSRYRGLLGGRRMLPWNIKDVSGMAFVGEANQITDPSRLLGMGPSGAKGASRPASLRSLIQQMITALRNLTPKITTLTSAIGKLTLAANKLAALITKVFLKPARTRGGAADGVNWRFYGNRDNVQGRAYNPRFDGMQYPPAVRQPYGHTMPYYSGAVGRTSARARQPLLLGAPNETGFDMPYYSGTQGKAYGRPPVRLKRTLRLGMYPMGGALMLGGGSYPARVGAGSFVGGARGPFLLGAGSGYPLGMPGAKDITGDVRVGSPYGAQGGQGRLGMGGSPLLLGAGTGGRSSGFFSRVGAGIGSFMTRPIGKLGGAGGMFAGMAGIGEAVAWTIKWSGVMLALGKVLQAVIEVMEITFLPAFNSLIQMMTGNTEAFSSMRAVFEFLNEWVGTGLQLAVGTILGAFQNILGFATGVFMHIVVVIKGVSASIADIFMGLTNLIRNSWLGRQFGWTQSAKDQEDDKWFRKTRKDMLKADARHWVEYEREQLRGIVGLGGSSAAIANASKIGAKGISGATLNPDRMWESYMTIFQNVKEVLGGAFTSFTEWLGMVFPTSDSPAVEGLADSVTVGGSSGLFEAGTLAAYEAVVKANSAVVDAITELRVQTIGRLDTIEESLDNLIDANSGVTMEYQ